MDALSSLGINGPYLLAQIVNFFVLLFLLRLFLYKPVTNMLESRKQRIAEGLQAAEVARREAEAERAQLQTQMEAERREAMDRIAAASKRGETLADEIEAGARLDAQRMIEQARARKPFASANGFWPKHKARSLSWHCWPPRRFLAAS